MRSPRRAASWRCAWESRTYAVWPVPIPDLRFTNLYGTDVTAERAIVRFPDQNPNPVHPDRPSGMLVYANPASAGLVAGLGLEIGERLPAVPRGDAGPRARRRPRRRSRSSSATGSTRCRRRHPRVRLHQPLRHGRDRSARTGAAREARTSGSCSTSCPSRSQGGSGTGEPLIADRFEDVTLLFADIVGFTRLSATMAPARAGRGPERRVHRVRRTRRALTASRR